MLDFQAIHFRVFGAHLIFQRKEEFLQNVLSWTLTSQPNPPSKGTQVPPRNKALLRAY